MPYIRVRSTPAFHCHKTVLSMYHRFTSVSCVGGFVSMLTTRGVGAFR